MADKTLKEWGLFYRIQLLSEDDPLKHSMGFARNIQATELVKPKSCFQGLACITLKFTVQEI